MPSDELEGQGQQQQDSDLYAPDPAEEARQFSDAFEAGLTDDEPADGRTPAAEQGEEAYQYEGDDLEEYEHQQPPAEAAAAGGAAQPPETPAAPPAPAPAQVTGEPTREQIIAQERAQLLDAQRQIQRASAEFQRRYGVPLRSDDDLRAEVEAIEAQQAVRKDLPEVDRAVQHALNTRIGDLEERLASASAAQQRAIETELSDLRVSSVHPDFFLIKNSPQDLLDWIGQMPKAHGDEMERRYKEGNPDEIAEMLMLYKQDRGVRDFRELAAGEAEGAEQQPRPAPARKRGRLAAAEAVPTRSTRTPVSTGGQRVVDDFDAAFDRAAEL